MFREPTRGDLEAQAGWTLMKRSATTPEHVVALDKYRDGCEALIPFAPAAGERRDEAPPVTTQPAVAKPDTIRTEPDMEFLHREIGVKSCMNGGQHKFNISTQRCVFCDKTRRQVLSRDPELMVM